MADEAFAELVRTTSSRLYRLALRMTGNPAEAEDILQETYLRAHVALCSGRFDGRAEQATWVYRIAVNAALDVIRRRERHSGLLARFPRHPAQTPERTEAHAVLAETAALLATLPEDQLAALVLTQVEELSNAEAAQALGCSEGAVEQRLIRARSTLRKRAMV